MSSTLRVCNMGIIKSKNRTLKPRSSSTYIEAQDYMKLSHDKAHRDLEFEVGEWAWLRLRQRTAISDRANAKLAPRYYGPFKVIERIGAVAYRLQLPPKVQIHDVFHVTFLKKVHGNLSTDVVPLPHIVNGRAVPAPDRVVRARPNKTSWDVLVQWVGRSPADATWELVEEFKASYPDFNLEDELFGKEGGSVVESFFRNKYQRRRKEKKSICN